MLLFFQFILCATLIFLTATQLSQSADILAEKTGLGRTWVGAILLAGATSLPELATGISAVVIFNAPDLAAGGIFGSCLFNLLILAFLDIFAGPTPLLQRAQVGHALAAGLGSILLGIGAIGIILAENKKNLTFGWVGAPSILLLLVYFTSARIIAQFEIKRRIEALEEAEILQYEHIKPKLAYLRFALLSLAITILGVWLASLGQEIATVTGLGESFIGSLLLAATTSLPEIIAGFAAIQLNAVDLAVSNVFGSNIFNMAILAIYDLTYIRGDLWSNISSVHIFTAIIAMMMTSVGIIGLIYSAAHRPSKLYITWDGIVLILLYITGMYIIYIS
ncbi:MAG: sodium:calcium antiporter [Calothrix sp. C42_A2020_038]|nr:sodium:calcium antiporter [Calothrix sp. C42_A2020_038]